MRMTKQPFSTPSEKLFWILELAIIAGGIFGLFGVLAFAIAIKSSSLAFYVFCAMAMAHVLEHRQSARSLVKLEDRLDRVLEDTNCRRLV